MNDTSRPTAALPFAVPRNRWDETAAAKLSPEGLLLYRSNLLGSDLTVTNFGGGNTSAKLTETDPLTGQPVTVLWVKGSGGDIGSMKLDGFSTLYLDKFRATERLYRGEANEDEMVGYLPHCTFNLNPRAASIDTPLHGLLPFAHIDHVHPDAIIALAAADGGEAATRDIWNGAVGWLAWKRPGFALAVQLRDHVQANPGLRGVMLAGHGIICWGDTAKACYDNTIDLIADAASHLNARLAQMPAFGGQARTPLSAQARADAAARLMPRLRAQMPGERGKIGHFSDDAEALEFVNSVDFERLAAVGTSCPDHFLRTKIAPLTLDPARLDDDAYLSERFEAYRAGYAAYYGRNAGPADPKMRDANPVVVLVPGLGRFTFAADKTTARLAGEFYGNAINVMRGAEAIGGYVGLPEQEAFNIEYWALEEAKLQRMPKPKPLVGKIALVTGGGGGIGKAVAARLLGEGCCVMLADISSEALEASREQLAQAFGSDVVRAARLRCDRRGPGAGRVRRRRPRIRRPGHPGRQRRHRLLRADRGDHRRAVAQELRRPRTGLLPGLARRLPAAAAAEGRLDHLHRLQEWAGRHAQRVRLCLGQGRRAAPGPLPGARGRRRRRPGQRREPRRGHQGLTHLGRRVAPGARRGLRHRLRRGAGGLLPQPLDAEAQRIARGHRRGGLLLRQRGLGQVDRQHHQRRRRKRPGLHPLRPFTR